MEIVIRAVFGRDSLLAMFFFFFFFNFLFNFLKEFAAMKHGGQRPGTFKTY